MTRATFSKRGQFSLFFLWIGLVHLSGLYFFTKGFLLTRQILGSRSSCDQAPRVLWPGIHGDDEGCWLRPTFKKAIVLIIDALRYDFTIPYSSSQTEKSYHNALTVLHTIALERPRNALLLPFLADPPTTTLQRLKALTTGTLPTFIEAGSNFAGSALTEDNLLDQLLLSFSPSCTSDLSSDFCSPHQSRRRLIHLGDDTWLKLFPEHFLPNLSHSFPSFVVEDLHTVDNGVTTHLLPLLRHDALRSEWDVIVGHFLGVDHVGHRFGAGHPLMRAKLQQMNAVMREVVAAIDNDEETVLVVMGDHGMDENGNHGGETLEEVLAAVWLYSPREFVGKRVADGGGRNNGEQVIGGLEAAVPQVDIVSTLALLLGVPIPFNNLGRPISEAFALIPENKEEDNVNWRRLVRVNALAAAQMERFHAEYTRLYGDHTGGVEIHIENFVPEEVDPEDEGSLERTFRGLRDYQAEMLRGYRRVWAQFNVLNMIEGVVVWLLSLTAMTCTLIDGSCFYGAWIKSRAALAGAAMGLLAAAGHFIYADPAYPLLESLILGFAISSLIALIAGVDRGAVRRCWQTKFSIGAWQAILFPLVVSAGFASNSYTIWEDEILMFFLSGIGLCTLASSTHRIAPILNLLLTRLASFSRLCREEQSPTCRTTFYRLESYTPWRILAPFLTAIFIIFTSRAIRPTNHAWHTVYLPPALLLNALFWTLQTASEQDWLASIMSEETSKTNRMIVARMVLLVSLAGAASAFVPSRRYVVNKPHIFTSAILLVCILVSPPTSGFLLALLYFQLLLLSRGTSYRVWPVMAALLGSFYFFSTGHNATFASIQWKAAYTGFRDVVYPWSSLMVGMNTFAGPILAACAVPFYASSLGNMEARIHIVLAHSAVYTLWTVSTAIWACILRRHLMLFAIFCPRFLMAGILMVVVDVISVMNSFIM
ncbi:GPI ethanolamine phosphate transferase 3 [Aspergillus saccharolyticus JOP 1030-1]|uniref:Alkaline phosphatase-like protein n=1 Tax=Aspergillus saccharolyticus JOP 1030-1 TaxID=1450539 RepID=A0A318ZG92_9EURO|nr:alkaline phosphatase-like protein [Aspergillus saccharolyticus JOP 1030-1]PYH46025.1 alkaline phosphatase-like protein [Aspergillus saccharolyticus JOP 1030-1]